MDTDKRPKTSHNSSHFMLTLAKINDTISEYFSHMKRWDKKCKKDF